MRVALILLCSLIGATAYADTILPNYGRENLVTDQDQKKLLREAIRVDLMNQGISGCTNTAGPEWDLTRYVLTDRATIDLYRLEGTTPLFVVRFYYSEREPYDVIDFKFFTNPEMTTITNTIQAGYSVERRKVNVGTLVDPVFKVREFAKQFYEVSCY